LWWIPAGHKPSVEEGLVRLAKLNAEGPTPDAFTFKARFPAPDKIGGPGDMKPEPYCVGWEGSSDPGPLDHLFLVPSLPPPAEQQDQVPADEDHRQKGDRDHPEPQPHGHECILPVGMTPLPAPGVQARPSLTPF